MAGVNRKRKGQEPKNIVSKSDKVHDKKKNKDVVKEKTTKNDDLIVARASKEELSNDTLSVSTIELFDSDDDQGPAAPSPSLISGGMTPPQGVWRPVVMPPIEKDKKYPGHIIHNNPPASPDGSDNGDEDKHPMEEIKRSSLYYKALTHERKLVVLNK